MRREQLAKALTAHGVEYGIHYSPAVHRHPIFSELRASRELDLPASERWAHEELSLPMFAEMEEDEVGRVVEVCRGQVR